MHCIEHASYWAVKESEIISDYQCRMKVGTASSVYNNIELLYLTDMIQVVHYISDSVHYNDIKLHICPNQAESVQKQIFSCTNELNGSLLKEHQK